MVSFPPCKINLGLHVVSKRPDGYHNLVTCFYPVPWTDILEIIPSDTLEFTASGIAIPGHSKDNLCLKAYSILKRDFDLPPVKIFLHKILPTGAGLGGGSSDAAHTIRLLNEIFSLRMSAEQQAHYAAAVGSDCAFFIYDKAMQGSGRGEILRDTKVTLKGKFLVIVKPDIHISTADAFAGIQPQQPAVDLQNTLEKKSIEEWRNLLVNDFEKTVFQKHPLLRDLKDQLYRQGAIYASMSGSGSTIFGIFNNEIDFNSSSTTAAWSGFL